MGLLSDQIGAIVMSHVSSASSAGSGSSNATGIPIKGMESVLFICTMIVAGSSDGSTTSDNTAVWMQVQYASNSSSGSDAATSNATVTCTDAIVKFTTEAAGTIKTLEFVVGAKAIDSQTGYIFPSIGGDSVSTMRVIAVPYPRTAVLPIAQSTAIVVADAG